MLLGGCAAYRPLPLGGGEGAAGATRLSVPASAMPLPELAVHRFDPADGLDATEVAMLAVANSPELKVQRDALGVARAQAFAAGLLPDPQLSFGEDFPQDSGDGATTAYSFGISADLSALLLRSSRRHAANAQAAQVNLDLLWTEWQTIAQARLLFGQVQSLRAQQTQLDAEQQALAPLDKAVQAALAAGNLNYDGASAGLDAMADVLTRDFITALRARGLPLRSIVAKHALRNAAIPVVTVLGLLFVSLLGGSVLIENVFSIPGLGQQAVAAGSTHDLPMIEGVAFYFTIIVIVVNLLVDLSYGLLDPKVRQS